MVRRGWWFCCESTRGALGVLEGETERERDRDRGTSWGYGGFVLLPQLRQQLRGLSAVPEREHLARMPLFAILFAVVFQHGNASLPGFSWFNTAILFVV